MCFLLRRTQGKRCETRPTTIHHEVSLLSSKGCAKLPPRIDSLKDLIWMGILSTIQPGERCADSRQWQAYKILQ